MIRLVIAVNEVNKRSVRLFFEAVLTEGRLELIEELIARDYLGRVSCVERAVVGPAGMRRFVCSRRRRHPGLCVVVEDQLAEDDRVVTRWRATVAPPPVAAPAWAAGEADARGWAVAYRGITIVRVLAGKQVDSDTCVLHRRRSRALSSLSDPSGQP